MLRCCCIPSSASTRAPLAMHLRSLLLAHPTDKQMKKHLHGFRADCLVLAPTSHHTHTRVVLKPSATSALVNLVSICIYALSLIQRSGRNILHLFVAVLRVSARPGLQSSIGWRKAEQELDGPRSSLMTRLPFSFCAQKQHHRLLPFWLTFHTHVLLHCVAPSCKTGSAMLFGSLFVTM